MIELNGRTAIVTGAGSGLGRSHALALAERGAQVVVNDLGADVAGGGRSHRGADAVVEEIVAGGGSAVAEYSSVASPEGGEAIVQRAIDEFGAVDILVNNAGNLKLSSFAKLDVRSIDEILDVHLGGAFYVTQPAYRAMLPAKRGSIIFTVSGVAAWGNLGASVYAAAKGGIIGLISVLKLEAIRHGIRVNAIAPMAQTRMSGEIELPEYLQITEKSLVPDLVAPSVVFLASDDCDLTGEIWSIGSGTIARMFPGRTVGYFKHPEDDGMLTPEDIAENLDQIRDPERYTVPKSWPDEFETVLENFRDP